MSRLSHTSSGPLSTVRSYANRLRQWAVHGLLLYAVAAGLCVVGALFFAAGVGVATAAGFHFLELRYDIWTAYAVVGGTFFGLALLLSFVAFAIFKKRASPIPRPPSAGVLLRQSLPLAAKFTGPDLGNGRLDNRSRMLAAGAAALLVAWIVVSLTDPSE